MGFLIFSRSTVGAVVGGPLRCLLLALALLPLTAGAAAAAPGTESGAPSLLAPGSGTGIYDVIAGVYGTTTDGLIGGVTASGHVLSADDQLVGLPGCTVSACPWLAPATDPLGAWGPQTSCADRDGLCWVELTNTETGACATAPVLDLGPFFLKDNWWAPRTARTYDLDQGIPAASVAAQGADLGFGPGRSDNDVDLTGRDQPPAISVAAGTWRALGLVPDQAASPLHVRLLWQAGLSHDQACGAGEAAPHENASTIDDVNLRAAPSAEAAQLAVVPSGDRLTVTGTAQNNFYPATASGAAGWLSADFLRFDAGNQDALVFTTDAVNLRAGPSMSDDALQVIPINSPLARTGEPVNGFLPVSYEGATGWVAAEYLA